MDYEMISTLMLAAFVVLLAIAAYSIFSLLFRWPGASMTSAIRTVRGGDKGKLEKNFIMPLARMFSRFIIMDSLREATMMEDLTRMNVKMTPREYYGRSFVLSLFFVLLGIPFGLFLGTWAMVAFVIIAIVLFIMSINDDRNKIRALNHEIEDELPRMIETLDYTMKVDRDLITFFGGYTGHSGPALQPEIHLLVFELESMDGEIALQRFAERLRLPPVINVVQVLISIYQGVQQHDSLRQLKQDMRNTKKENMLREIEKRPRKAMIVHIGMLLAVLLMLAGPFGLIALRMFQSI